MPLPPDLTSFLRRIIRGDVLHITRVLFAALLVAGCGEGSDLLLPGDGQPAAIKLEHGDGQSARIGEPLPDSLVFVVRDSRGRPVEGATIAFDLGSAGPGADIVPDTARSDANGRADARMVLGTTIGAQVGEAVVVMGEGVQEPRTTFTMMAYSENANGIAALSGEDQSGPAGTQLGLPLVVQVTDAFGNPIAGVPITWTPEGGGSVSEASNVTDGDGRASVQRTLGSVAGPQSTVATSTENLAGAPVTFIHTATAGSAAGLWIESGNGQTAQTGTELPGDLVVRLVDASGNGVSGAGVTWVVSTGGGSVSPQNSTTDEAGRTSARWTLGPNPGENRVDAVVSGVGVVGFTAVGTASRPAALTIVTQPPSSIRNGETFGIQPVIQVLDAAGNPAATPGILITAQLSGGGGELLGTRQVLTDASGRATFTDLAIAGAEGTRRLVFTAPGFAGATSAVIQVQAIPTATTITSDTPDPSVAGGSITIAFRVAAEGLTPIGTVTVTDGNQSCSGTLFAGSGTCQLTLSTTGLRTLRAMYSGSAGLTASFATESHQVDPVPASNNPPTAGFTANCTELTCRFSDTSSDSDGSVLSWAWTFGDGGGTQEREPSHTYATPGTFSVTLTVTDDDGVSDQETKSVTVAAPPPPSPAPTSTTITGDTPDPSDAGAPITVSFTVSSAAGAPAGTVTVTDENGGGCSGSAPAGSCVYTPNGNGNRTITARYDGNSSFAGSSDTEDHVVNGAPPPPPAGTTTTITEDSPDPSEQGNAITVRFTVSSGSGTPTGTVTVSDANGGGCEGSAPSGSCTYTPNGIGTRTITATYAGGAGFQGSADTEQHTVSEPPPPPPAGTTTTITEDSPDPSEQGTAITVGFSVTSESGTPTGTVSVSDANGGGCEGSAPSGSCTYTPNGIGTRTITATYAGGAGFQGSADTEQHTVIEPPPPPPAGTTTTITEDSPDPSEQGTAITVSFSVTSESGTPTGTVTVSDANGGGCTGSAPSGSCTYTPNGTGTRTITASYEGNASFQSSNDTEQHTVAEPPPPEGTTTEITAVNPEPSDPGAPVTVSFAVTSGSGIPNGNVRITDQNGDGCTGNAPSGDCTYTPNGSGTFTITATYEGNSSFQESSASRQHTINQPNAAPLAIVGSRP